MTTVALGFVKARGERGGLSEVAPQADDLQVRIGLDQIGQQFVAAVGGSVVDEQNLIRPARPISTVVNRS